MGFRQCSSCKGYYNDKLGGCINPQCSACDRARVSKITRSPVVPKTKIREKPSWLNVKSKPIDGQGIVPKVSGPPPVVIPESDAISKLADQQSDTGFHIIYRGDTRAPAQLKTYNGFTAWVPLSEEQARDVVRRSQGQNFKIKLPPKAKRLEDAFNKNQNLNLLTLGRQIKLEKAGDTFHISTDPTEGCGGYTSGYIYAMKFKTLYLIDKSGNVSTGPLKDVSGINPKLVLDTQSLSTAKVIGVVIPGQGGVEVAFLTSIQMDNIYKYRAPQSPTWFSITA